MVIIKDSKGNSIPSNQITIHSCDDKGDILQVVINDGSDLITQYEWLLIKYLLVKAIDYGGGVEKIRNYIELFDKIEKIVERNDCK